MKAAVHLLDGDPVVEIDPKTHLKTTFRGTRVIGRVGTPNLGVEATGLNWVGGKLQQPIKRVFLLNE